MRFNTHVWALVFVFTALPVIAQDFFRANKNIFFVKSERVLSGINPFEDSVAQVISKLGRPTRVVTVRKDFGGFPVTGCQYEWDGKTSLLRVISSDCDGSEARITQVDVWGSHPDGPIGTTGRGLKLGDLVSKARAIYGLRSYFGVTASEEYHPRWTTDGCSHEGGWLQIEFGQAERINHIGTSLPYGFCW